MAEQSNNELDTAVVTIEIRDNGGSPVATSRLTTCGVESDKVLTIHFDDAGELVEWFRLLKIILGSSDTSEVMDAVEVTDPGQVAMDTLVMSLDEMLNRAVNDAVSEALDEARAARTDETRDETDDGPDGPDGPDANESREFGA